MGSFCTSDPPQPPNPFAVAGAQTSTNVNTALANAFLNNTNQVTPLGNLTYDQTGSYQFTDPTSQTQYDIPRFTATQTLSPEQQAIQSTNQRSQQNLASLAANQSGYLADYLRTPFVGQGAPGAGDASTLGQIPGAQASFADAGQQQMSLGDYGQQQGTFGDAGNIVRGYGPADDFSADRGRVEQALYGRLNPQLERERSNIEQRLADQGIRYGSQAYTSAMDDYARQANDARLAVTQTAGAEQARMANMAAQEAGFENAAQQQAYTQAQGRGTFANTAQAQQFQEGLTSGQFANTAQQNAFIQAAQRGTFANAANAQRLAHQQAMIGAQNTARSQYLTEGYAQRNQPINEVTALLSGSQVHQPTFAQTPTNQIPTTDIAGLLNQNFNQNLEVYKQQSANSNATLGGVLGLGGNLAKAFTMSDRRVKKDIHKLGTVFAADAEGDDHELPIYRYAYKGDPASTRHVGPMAQDVEKVDPGAVRSFGGVKHISPQRVMGSIMRAA